MRKALWSSFFIISSWLSPSIEVGSPELASADLEMPTIPLLFFLIGVRWKWNDGIRK